MRLLPCGIVAVVAAIEEDRRVERPEDQLIAICDQIFLMRAQQLAVEVRPIHAVQIGHNKVLTTPPQQAMLARNAVPVRAQFGEVEDVGVRRAPPPQHDGRGQQQRIAHARREELQQHARMQVETLGSLAFRRDCVGAAT